MRWIGLVVAVLSLLVTGAATGMRRGDPEARWPVCGQWRAVPVRDGLGSVTDVAVVSPTEAWAITDRGYEVYNESFIYRWAGVRWSRVPIPEPTTGDIPYWELTALGVVSSSEIWAVGYEIRYDTGFVRPIAAMWNGVRWRWVHIGIPHVRGQLLGVTVVPGTHRVWAVGHDANRDYARRSTLVLLWNGEEWRRAASPSPGVWSEYRDVVSVGGATWAVGTTRLEGGAPRLLASKWTGAGWTIRTGPRGTIEAVDGLGPRDLWAVGWTPFGHTSRALISRWDGSGWSLARRLDRVDVLHDIEVAGPASAWAVGGSWVRSEQSSRPFIVRRVGGRWWVDFAPDLHGRMTAIGGTPHNLWAFRADNPDLAEFAIFDTYHRC